MKSCIEYCNLRNTLHNAFANFNTCKVSRVVKRTERDTFSDSFLNGFVNKNAAAELFAAVKNSVANSCDVVN